jgi:hypothetical protein
MPAVHLVRNAIGYLTVLNKVNGGHGPDLKSFGTMAALIVD